VGQRRLGDQCHCIEDGVVDDDKLQRGKRGKVAAEGTSCGYREGHRQDKPIIYHSQIT